MAPRSSGKSVPKSGRPPKKLDVARELALFKQAAVVARQDTWQNALTGLGIAGRDWRTANSLRQDEILDRETLDTIYLQDNLAARVVDAIPEHATRRWVKISAGEGEDSSDFQSEIFKHFDRLKVKQRFTQWMKLARKDGGCAMLIGADDGQTLDMPLDLARVREIRHLHNIERWALLPDIIDLDPMSPSFNEPLYYKVLPRPIWSSTFSGPGNVNVPSQAQGTMTTGMLVHRSRLFVNEGVQISEIMKLAQKGWGFSRLQRAWESIQNYRVLWSHIATLFKHVAQTVVKFAGFGELQGADFQKAINARLAAIQLQRSTTNIVALDSEDTFETQTLQGLSGALEVFMYAQEDLAQASDMPLTQLFGHTPKGFSAEDGPGMRNFYDSVRQTQEDLLLEPLTNLITMLAACEHIPEPDGWALDFLPLLEPTDVEVADKRNKDALTSKMYVEMGALDPNEVRETLRADPKNDYHIEPGEAEGDPIANPPPEPVLPPGMPVPGVPPKKKAFSG